MLRTAIFQLRDDQHAVLVVVGLQCQNKEIQLVSNHTTAASGLLACAVAEDNFTCIVLLWPYFTFMYIGTDHYTGPELNDTQCI